VCRLGAQLDRDSGHCPPSLLALGVTSITQLVIVLISGSVALLADTIYNFSDALTAIPLRIAFALGRRAATRRYTHGFGRVADLALLRSQ
jgi:divalent metal cation (Fe/Co/Zn/Cd) transporter